MGPHQNHLSLHHLRVPTRATQSPAGQHPGCPLMGTDTSHPPTSPLPPYLSPRQDSPGDGHLPGDPTARSPEGPLPVKGVGTGTPQPGTLVPRLELLGHGGLGEPPAPSRRVVLERGGADDAAVRGHQALVAQRGQILLVEESRGGGGWREAVGTPRVITVLGEGRRNRWAWEGDFGAAAARGGGVGDAGEVGDAVVGAGATGGDLGRDAGGGHRHRVVRGATAGYGAAAPRLAGLPAPLHPAGRRALAAGGCFPEPEGQGEPGERAAGG